MIIQNHTIFLVVTSAYFGMFVLLCVSIFD